VQHLEEQRVALPRAGEDLAGAGDDLVLGAGVVEAAVAERHGLDGAAGHGAADGDGLELRHERRQEAVPQRLSDEVTEGHAGLGGARPLGGVDGQDVRQVRGVDLLVAVPRIVGARDHVGDGGLADGGVPGSGLLVAAPHRLGDAAHAVIVRRGHGRTFSWF
jgi:hypothetical protein